MKYIFIVYLFDVINAGILLHKLWSNLRQRWNDTLFGTEGVYAISKGNNLQINIARQK